jgi:hypothetical protein
VGSGGEGAFCRSRNIAATRLATILSVVQLAPPPPKPQGGGTEIEAAYEVYCAREVVLGFDTGAAIRQVHEHGSWWT